MSRITVIGNSGGGKSTLARRLARQLDLPYVEIDALLWNEGWTLVEADAFESRHQAHLNQDRWVIDGLGRIESIANRLQHATDIILIDLPLWIHFWLAAKRHVALMSGKTEPGPGGGRDPPPLEGLFRTIWEVDQTWMPTIRALCDAAEQNGARVVRIRDLAELDEVAQTFSQTPPG